MVDREGAAARLEWLRRAPLFDPLPADVAGILASRFTEVTFPAGAPLIRQGDAGDCLLLLTSGSASVSVRDETGAGQPLASVGPGEVVGEMALLTHEPRSADVVALEVIRALRLDRVEFLELAVRYPALSTVLSKVVSDRFGRAEADALMGKTIEGYRVRRCVGRGGMAIVYEAERLHDGQTVALKMMSHKLVYNHDLFQRFQREADVLASLSHPNIAALHGRFSAYGTYFLVMEFCDGQDLEKLVDRVGALREEDARPLLGQLSMALDHLHSSGVVHRDVKPSNVMVNRDGRVKLTDFGIAMPQVDARLTEKGQCIGTPLYMAPEQMMAKTVDHRADTYALGCVAYFLVTGKPPFTGGSFPAVLAEKLDWKMPSGGPIPSSLSAEFREILSACLAARPEDRTVDLRGLSSWACLVDGRLTQWSVESLSEKKCAATELLTVPLSDVRDTGVPALALRLTGLWERLGATTSVEHVHRRLVEAYTDPMRCYHDLSHIRFCLEEFDRVTPLAEEPELVEAALWFHDAVHDPRASDNESRSADLAVAILKEAGLDEAQRLRVARMILATQHRGDPRSPDSALVADIDLAGLALPPDQFDANTDRIRQEYLRAGVEDPEPGMTSFLDGLFRREWLYWTPHYRQTIERAARSNLRRALEW